jgi:hypothetical protein
MEYDLAKVGGEPLPAIVVHTVATNGTVYDLQAVGGWLRLYADGTFKRRRDVRNVWNGVPDDTLNWDSRQPGTFVLTDTTLVLSFLDARGAPELNTYLLLDGGKSVAGIETYTQQFPNTYEYKRR